MEKTYLATVSFVSGSTRQYTVEPEAALLLLEAAHSATTHAVTFNHSRGVSSLLLDKVTDVTLAGYVIG